MAEQENKFNLSLINGRLENTQTANNGKVYSEVTLPAPDSFSSPAQIKIESRQPLGQNGQTIQVLCHFAGFVRTFQTSQDKATPNNTAKSGRDVQMWLIAVDK